MFSNSLSVCDVLSVPFFSPLFVVVFFFFFFFALLLFVLFIYVIVTTFETMCATILQPSKLLVRSQTEGEIFEK